MSETNLPISRQRGRAGLFVLAAAAVLVVAVLQADLLEDWLTRTVNLKVIIPEQALAGVEVGSDVLLFGTQIGEVTDVVIRPDQPFYAEAKIREEVTPFIRADSKVFVRRQFAIAGTAFLEVQRGNGAELDWDIAVLEVTVQKAAADSLEQLLAEAQARVFPLIEEVTRAVAAAVVIVEDLADPESPMQRAIADVAGITEDMRAGKGSVGRLVVDDTLVREAENALGAVATQVDALDLILADVQTVVGDVAGITGDLRREADLAGLVQSLDRTLASTDAALRSVTALTPTLADAAEGAGEAARALPSVLVRVSQALAQLEEVLDRLRRSWLLGGGSDGAGDQPGPAAVRP